jgi:hypothetical protein
MNAKCVSLRAELDLIRSAVEGVRLLGERLRDVTLPETLPATFVPALNAALVLVEVRLRDLDRLVAGRIDPDGHATRQTTAVVGEHGAEHRDIYFGWTSKERLHHCKRELRAARVRHRRCAQTREET